MSQYPPPPGHEPTTEFTSDDRSYFGDDQPHEIASHRARGRWGRRRLFLIAFGVALLVGSGVAYGTQRQHADNTAAVGSRPVAGSSTSEQLPSLPLDASSSDVPPSPSAGPSPGSSATTSAAAGTSPKSTATTSTKPTPSKSAAAKSTAGSTTSSGEKTIKAYLTGYSYFDNTPPGSVDISNPVLHTSAGGTGTYADPITLAVGHSLIGGKDILDWPAGTRFYVPNLRKYFIAEDTCGDGSDPQSGPCHVGYPSSASTWLDLWIGGKGGTTSGSNSCMDAITGVWTVIVKPPSGLATVAGSVYGSSGCAKQYGNTVTTG